MIDIMAREEIPGFEWLELEMEGQQVLVQNPEEMLFEKITALLSADDPQIKWGIDIAILRRYLMKSKDMSEERIDTYLSTRWEEYQRQIARRDYLGILDMVANGTAPKAALAEGLSTRMGRDISAAELADELIPLAGEDNRSLVLALLQSDQSTFESRLLDLAAILDSVPDYTTATQEALAVMDRLEK
jgi:hypothetical protein